MTVGRLKFHDSSGWVYAGAGLSGYSGYSGAGASGYSGYSGAGASGYSGYSGTASPAGLSITIDGGGSAITSGIKGDIEIPFASTITAARIGADQSGLIAIDVWAAAYSGYPPVDGGSIDVFAIGSSGIKSEETGLSHSLNAGDWLRFNVDSCTTITRATLSLTMTRP